MADFTLTSTAKCEYCGNPLSSSTEECGECSPEDADLHFFRRMVGDYDIVRVESTARHKWEKLEEVTERAHSFEYIGTKETVHNLVGGDKWPTIEDVPSQAKPVTLR